MIFNFFQDIQFFESAHNVMSTFLQRFRCHIRNAIQLVAHDGLSSVRSEVPPGQDDRNKSDPKFARKDA